MRIGILTGSGTHALPGLQGPVARVVSTRFGGAQIADASWRGVEVVLISRHGERHQRLSNHVNHRANVLALCEAGVEAVLATTVCGAVDPTIELGTVVVFDDLYFLGNRLPDGAICSLHDRPGVPGRGHWVYEMPFSGPLRAALLEGAAAAGVHVRDGGCYGHVDGPRFNTRAEIRMLSQCGVSAVSQTAGPETVLCGEAEVPYALIGFVTDYANGVSPSGTPVAELMRLVRESTAAFAAVIGGALTVLPDAAIEPTGTQISWR
jgi:5'-methylthioadenosine phosphorylase